MKFKLDWPRMVGFDPDKRLFPAENVTFAFLNSNSKYRPSIKMVRVSILLFTLSVDGKEIKPPEMLILTDAK